jgi:hypothetical protein
MVYKMHKYYNSEYNFTRSSEVVNIKTVWQHSIHTHTCNFLMKTEKIRLYYILTDA